MGGQLPINLNRNNDLGRPLSFGEVDQNFNIINTSINNIQEVDSTIHTNHTLTFADAGKLLLIDTTSTPITIMVPDYADVPFNVGQHFDIVQYGTNSVIITNDKNGRINSFNSKTSTAGQYVGVTIINVAADEWLLIGNLI